MIPFRLFSFFLVVINIIVITIVAVILLLSLSLSFPYKFKCISLKHDHHFQMNEMAISMHVCMIVEMLQDYAILGRVVKKI